MKLRHNTKRIFTAALVFWMSGVIVLFCCGNMPAKAAEIESCPLAKKGHCTKTAEQNLVESFGQKPLSFDCCAFPAKIFDKIRKLEKSPEPLAIAATVEIAAPPIFAVEKIFKTAKFHRSFVRNRGGTYLQNQVFRI